MCQMSSRNIPAKVTLSLARSSEYPLEGWLYHAIKNNIPYNKKLFSLLIKKNSREDLGACLYLAIYRYPNEREFLLKLALKSEFGLDGCLLHAIVVLPYDRELFITIASKTRCFYGCLFSALTYKPRETNFLFYLLEKTRDYEWCLLKATENISIGVNKRFVRELFYRTNNYYGALYWSIFYFNKSKEDFDYLDSVFEMTTDFTGCLQAAIFTMPENTRFINKLIEVTTDFSFVLHISEDPEVIERVILKKI